MLDFLKLLLHVLAALCLLKTPKSPAGVAFLAP
jgi:hypothetical protein